MGPKFLLHSSRQNCLATKRGRSLARCNVDKAVLSWRTRALFFSMKSASFPRKLRLHCFGCSRSVDLNEWEVAASFPLTFELSPLLTAIWRQPLLQEHFWPTSSTG